MRSSPIVRADVVDEGTQMKLLLTLKGNQNTVFKPKRFLMTDMTYGYIYGGPDRHEGEIVAFYLSLLLNMTSVLPTVRRRVSVRNEVLPVASRDLARTFFVQGRKSCLYGVCHFCRRTNPACDDGEWLEGALILWVPRSLTLNHVPHPWARTYFQGKLAPWEKHPDFCDRFESPSSSIGPQQLLDIIDVSVFDFLLQNGDRHHFSWARVADTNESAFIILDNGKSLKNAYTDHLDILAPLLQCCKLRKSMYESLSLLVDGGLSEGLMTLMEAENPRSLLPPAHLEAMDRRLKFVMAAVEACLGMGKHVLQK